MTIVHRTKPILRQYNLSFQPGNRPIPAGRMRASWIRDWRVDRNLNREQPDFWQKGLERAESMMRRGLSVRRGKWITVFGKFLDPQTVVFDARNLKPATLWQQIETLAADFWQNRSIQRIIFRTNLTSAQEFLPFACNGAPEKGEAASLRMKLGEILRVVDETKKGRFSLGLMNPFADPAICELRQKHRRLSVPEKVKDPNLVDRAQKAYLKARRQLETWGVGLQTFILRRFVKDFSGENIHFQFGALLEDKQLVCAISHLWPQASRVARRVEHLIRRGEEKAQMPFTFTLHLFPSQEDLAFRAQYHPNSFILAPEEELQSYFEIDRGALVFPLVQRREMADGRVQFFGSAHMVDDKIYIDRKVMEAELRHCLANFGADPKIARKRHSAPGLLRETWDEIFDAMRDLNQLVRNPALRESFSDHESLPYLEWIYYGRQGRNDHAHYFVRKVAQWLVEHGIRDFKKIQRVEVALSDILQNDPLREGKTLGMMMQDGILFWALRHINRDQLRQPKVKTLLTRLRGTGLTRKQEQGRTHAGMFLSTFSEVLDRGEPLSHFYENNVMVNEIVRLSGWSRERVLHYLDHGFLDLIHEMIIHIFDVKQRDIQEDLGIDVHQIISEPIAANLLQLEQKIRKSPFAYGHTVTKMRELISLDRYYPALEQAIS